MVEDPTGAPFLSVVIPAYNEEARIAATLKEVIAFLSTRPYRWEVVVADDGSADGTAALVDEAIKSCPAVRLLRLPHGGKGWAVKNGMLAAKGRFRFICDADLSMPIDQVERFLPPLERGVDIVLGSREAPQSRRIGEPALRHLMGRMYNSLVRLLALRGIGDTQCGFKCFRGESAPWLFQQQKTYGFAFDVEVLFLARKAGLTMQEVGIDWHYRQQSKVHPLRDSVAMTWDILKIRFRYLSGRYSAPPAGSDGNP